MGKEIGVSARNMIFIEKQIVPCIITVNKMG
jgi:hypothetical protein